MTAVRETPASAPRALGLLDRVNVAAGYAVGALLGLATISVTYQILIRFVLDHFGVNIAAPWTEEVARYALIWVVFVGAGVVCRYSGLIAVDIVPHALPSPYGRYVKIAAILVTIAFFGVLAWMGVEFAATGSIETSPVMRIPMTVVYLAVPVGSALAVVNLSALLLEGLFGGRDIVETGSEASE
ncbi:TRAP transporter small permease [Mesorhizobium marinum]|uniref:TRAP transporter small permease n=1 Tax=Mesorhizobium marinum TaxID=3228790 RepID=UPI003467B1D9